eukprot:1160134-Pelagomonas_calceolata.AAC.2
MGLSEITVQASLNQWEQATANAWQPCRQAPQIFKDDMIQTMAFLLRKRNLRDYTRCPVYKGLGSRSSAG